ncbi:MAG TPA: hypothetical protein VGL15_05010 [Vicinamibacteria bacterium]
MRPRYALAMIVVLAAGLRFTGLSAGLRHRPGWDERAFVDAAGLMLASGDLDHRFQEYPALLVYLLAPALAFLHGARPGPGAYIVNPAGRPSPSRSADAARSRSSSRWRLSA